MIRILFSLIVVVCTTASSFATTYTFIATSGLWDDEDNWDPTGKPVSGDTAIIPNGKTCLVQNGNEAVKIVQVDSGGTLGIVGRTLTLGVAGDTTSSTVNGLIYLKESGATPGVLKVQGFPTLGGSGIVSARKADGYGAGRFTSLNNQQKLTINSGVTCKGSITFLVDFDNYGTLQVDHADDEMTFGYASTQFGRYDGGGGTLSVSAGLARFNHFRLAGALRGTSRAAKSGSPTWQLNSARRSRIGCN
ncbi:MAG: hypothetical protein CHACPFDD_03760 [Phycisphaerae bacterium]|nr:hypothetical protein [Phycisphaerae bacterium]